MMETYGGQKTLLNVLLEMIDAAPEGLTLEQMVNEVAKVRPQSRRQSVAPTLTQLQSYGLIERVPSVWRIKR
ncbi:MAG: hypothetical protein AB7E70_21645 [Hyphomicrobiaceae bacterium]